jgi:hypothetical protein
MLNKPGAAWGPLTEHMYIKLDSSQYIILAIDFKKYWTIFPKFTFKFTYNTGCAAQIWPKLDKAEVSVELQ